MAPRHNEEAPNGRRASAAWTARSGGRPAPVRGSAAFLWVSEIYGLNP